MINSESRFSVTRQYSHSPASPEPMIMGSPSSPIPSSSISSSHSQYLPGFLLGDHTPSSSAQSPVHGGRARSIGSSVAKLVPGVNLQSPQPFGSAKRYGDVDEIPTSRMRDKISAPPVSGLLDSSLSGQHQTAPAGLSFSRTYDTPDCPQFPLAAGISSPLGARGGAHKASFSTQMSHSTPAVFASPSFNQTLDTSQPIHCSPTQMDPFYSQGEDLSPHDILDETWVTVFGFPQGAAGYILQQFSEYGTIEHHIISNEGNWMHLHYQSKIAAKKALSKNGKVVGNSVMVGVSQCIDKGVMHGTVVSSPSSSDACIRLHSVQHTIQTPKRASSYCESPLSKSKISTPIRSLSKAYQTAATGKEIMNTDNSTKTVEVWWKKAMEYAFGW